MLYFVAFMIGGVCGVMCMCLCIAGKDDRHE